MFDEIIKAVHKWLEQTLTKYSSEIKADIQKDDADFLHVFLEGANYLSELTVSKPYFAPYRYVSFLVMSLSESVNAQPIFVYYDDNDDTTEKIIEELNRGIQISVNS